MRSRTFSNLFASAMVLLMLLTFLLISSVRMAYGLDRPADQAAVLVIDALRDPVYVGG